MNRNLFGKFLFVLFVLGWSLWELYPPTPRSLLQEFQNQAVNKDTNFTAIVEKAAAMQAENPQAPFYNLRTAVGDRTITNYFPHIPVDPGVNSVRTILQELQRDAAGEIKLGLDLQGGTYFLLGMQTNVTEEADGEVADEDRERLLANAVEVLRKRVDKLGVAEPLIQPVGENQIAVQLPGLSEAEKEQARTSIKKAAFLQFRMVHPRSSELLQKGLTAAGYEVLHLRDVDRNGQETFTPLLVKKKEERGLTGKFVRRSFVNPNPITNEPEILLDFDSEGRDKFAAITREHTGQLLAIVLDGELYSAPRINEPILNGSASISGDFTWGEAYSLANVLANPLERPLEIEQERSVEPSLGRDSIRSGVLSGLIAMIMVAAFMLVYYLFAGLLANVALLLNIIILLGVMCSIDAVLTLPGIAGIILTLGMAVDANVLIYERIREELENGKSIRGSIAAGYSKAFGTIFDSNVTTLIASIILIFLGTGPVKGFGVTLTIGLLVNMFTALLVTRLIFDWFLSKDLLRSLKMLRLIRPTRLDFLRWSKPAFVLSWLLVLVGLGYAISRGSDVLGIDFKGGDLTTFGFEQRVEVGQVRDALNQAGISDVMIQYQKDPIGNELLQVTSAFNEGSKVKEVLTAAFPEAGLHTESTEAVGPSVGNEILRTALIATLLALFGILIYVAMRYEFSFSVAAVVAVLHDVFMTIGLFCLTGREFSAPMVAAILTIIGFSMNDTIVIFDRIREDLKLGVRGTFKELMNTAMNQTLSRTIITSGTTFLATVTLYIFGGPVINDFAFTFLVGVITGTYSSIFIACAIVLWWHKGERPRTTPQMAVQEAPVPARA